MSATAHDGSAHGVPAAADDGDAHQTPAGADQHLQIQKTATHDMATAGRGVGETSDGASPQEGHQQDHQQEQQQKHRKGVVSATVDTIVNKALGFGGASKAEKRRSLGAA
ncbi:hypothetical protein LX36DRAFT_593738 [Colletotrichum falcatum]|nr:hypothetical protein LX36DRAFT_593738 [Colletotrichum falcatum]